MSERNAIKDRPCGRCGEIVRGKAHKLKVHAREHVTVERQAAAQALIKKMYEDMHQNDHFLAPNPTELETQDVEALVDPSLFRMADEEVLNAEGD